MNALIDLKECREYATVTLGETSHYIKLSGTIDDPYFCGKDVCVVLGYKDPKDALQRYVDKDDKKQLFMVFNNHTLGGSSSPPQSISEDHHTLGKKNFSYREGQTIFVSEAGLYSLILSSQAPFAKEFKKLVCKVILPSIRKHGSYYIESKLTYAMEQLSIKEKSEEELQAQLNHEKERADQAEEQSRLKEEARRKAELKAQRVNKFMRRATIKEKKMEWIYIATTKNIIKKGYINQVPPIE